MRSLIRSNHFREYCKNIYIYCCSLNGMDAVEASNKWEEEIYQDFNNLSWILDSLFPNSRPSGQDYHFITDPINHIDKNTKREIPMGKVTIKIEKGRERIYFENPDFKHGQVGVEGYVRCYGTFGHNFSQALMKIGFSGALTEFYNFSRISDHGTWYKGQPWN